MAGQDHLNLVTLGIAIYGALLSTATVVWTMFRDTRDKGRLKIDLMVGRILTTGGVPPPFGLGETDRVFITMTNVGRRPITVSKISGVQGPLRRHGWFRWHRQAFILFPRNLPRALNPGDSVNEWMENLSDIYPVRALYAWDSTGGRWHASRRELRWTKERAMTPEPPPNHARQAAPQPPHP